MDLYINIAFHPNNDQNITLLCYMEKRVSNVILKEKIKKTASVEKVY